MDPQLDLLRPKSLRTSPFSQIQQSENDHGHVPRTRRFSLRNLFCLFLFVCFVFSLSTLFIYLFPLPDHLSQYNRKYVYPFPLTNKSDTVSDVNNNNYDNTHKSLLNKCLLDLPDDDPKYTFCIFLSYGTSVWEGFNQRKEIFLRVANFVKAINHLNTHNHNNNNNLNLRLKYNITFFIVLPSNNQIPHWTNNDNDDWNVYFDMENFKKLNGVQIPFISFKTFNSFQKILTGTNQNYKLNRYTAEHFTNTNNNNNIHNLPKNNNLFFDFIFHVCKGSRFYNESINDLNQRIAGSPKLNIQPNAFYSSSSNNNNFNNNHNLNEIYKFTIIPCADSQSRDGGLCVDYSDKKNLEKENILDLKHENEKSFFSTFYSSNIFINKFNPFSQQICIEYPYHHYDMAILLRTFIQEKIELLSNLKTERLIEKNYSTSIISKAQAKAQHDHLEVQDHKSLNFNFFSVFLSTIEHIPEWPSDPSRYFIEKSLDFSNKIKQISHQIINKFFASRSEKVFNSVHIRRGDFSIVHSNNYFSLDSIVKALLDFKKSSTVNLLFIASDMNQQEWNSFLDLVNQNYPYASLSTQIIRIEHLINEYNNNDHMLSVGMNSLVSQLICAESRTFIASPFSTFSLFISRYRRFFLNRNKEANFIFKPSQSGRQLVIQCCHELQVPNES